MSTELKIEISQTLIRIKSFRGTIYLTLVKSTAVMPGMEYQDGNWIHFYRDLAFCAVWFDRLDRKSIDRPSTACGDR